MWLFGLRIKRLLLIIVKIRDYKRMDIRGFRDDIESVLFYIVFIFNDFDDNLWVW